MKIFAGIGSRNTPPEICDLMRNIARELSKKGWTLRSGAADGADSAFERGVDQVSGPKEIYLPYKGFRGSKSPLFAPPPLDAFLLAATVHPYFEHFGLQSFARMAHGRNMQQVLGKDLSVPADMVICWTPDGAENEEESKGVEVTGGTRSAVVLAARRSIPVFNLARPCALARLVAFVKEEPLPPKDTTWVPDASLISAIKKAKRESRRAPSR